MYDDFQIAIPSRSRPHVQITIRNLSQNFWKYIVLVVPESQYSDYRAAVQKEIEIIPFGTSGIGLKRQFMLTMRKTGKVIMIDDDLTFYRRLPDDASKFVRMSPDDSEKMIFELIDFLDKYAMIGMVDKFMSQTRPRGHIECSRFNKVLGFNRDMFPDPWPRFRLPHDEEHDIHLQFLTRGFRTAVLTEYSKSDPVQAPGGCTDWRSPEVFAETYRLLLQYWPDVVSVRGETKVSYRWKKAMEIGGLL